jgi:hypothetical protein
MSEATCVYVSSRGIMKSCDVYPMNPVSSTRRCYDYDWATLKPNSSVYVIGSALPDFLLRCWPHIHVPIVLVTGDCDQTMPLDVVTEQQFTQFINHPNLLAWFSQNLVLEHPKLHPIPIGMDYHTLSVNTNHPWGPQQTPQNQEYMLQQIRKRETEREKKAYANFQFSMQTRYAQDRRDALKEIPKEAVYYEPTPVNRFKTWVNQSKYAFVISPFGGGLDCHRTWEALALGSIPIIHSSPLNKMFEGLPVLFVNSWADVSFDTLPVIEKGLYPKLTLKYWTDLIKDVRLQVSP